MDKATIELGLAEVGKHLQVPTIIILAGSAASVLRGDITRAARDCDVADVKPNSQEEALLGAGSAAGMALGLEPGWLNTECMAWHQDFPIGWQQRAIPYRSFGNLDVQVISKADCASLRVLRLAYTCDQRDLQDISEMALSSGEMELIEQHMASLEQQDYDVSIARVLLMRIRRP